MNARLFGLLYGDTVVCLPSLSPDLVPFAKGKSFPLCFQGICMATAKLVGFGNVASDQI
jgi:hypothetical protein